MGGRGKSFVQREDEPPAAAEVVGEIDPESGDVMPVDASDEPELSRFRSDDDKPYELQRRGDFTNGRGYALLEATGRDWRIITRPASEFDRFAEEPADRFSMEEPTLSWAKDGKAVHIYVEGMTTQEFLDEVGLELDLQNTTTTSKRLSRLFRPQTVTGWFDADDISISYTLSQPKWQRIPDPDNPGETTVQWGTESGDELPPEVVEKVWDGAGVVSRDMLLRMIDQLPDDMNPKQRNKTIRELRHAKRVEFTVMTEDGQLKGHGVVSEKLSTDFVVPEDIKQQVKLTDPSQRYIAFAFPHGHDHMRLDVQSLVNLHPFFEENQLLQWLEDDFSIFEESVRTGDITNSMAKLDKNVTIEDLQRWNIREFAARGGDINWSSSMVKSYLNSYLDRVQDLTDPESKLKLPIPGGRYYVMPSMVGRRANMPVQVARGEVTIDQESGTAWVNDQDWIELQNSESYGKNVPMDERWGIGSLLGGADHDDALWAHPFTDHDGEQKMLLWRSPNEAGERVILKPSDKSATLGWQTLAGDVEFPAADSRKLPARADRMSVYDRGLIDLNPQVNDMETVDSNQRTPLHEAMRQAALREETNAALLGSVCNYQLVYKAVHGEAPPERPAPLEEVIDLKKTGADGSAVADWVWAKRLGLLQSQMPIPRLLANRVSTSRQQAALTDGSHWVDKIEQAINEHVVRVKAIRDEMIAETKPPKILFDYVMQEPEHVDAGAALNQAYSSALARERTTAWREGRDIDFDVPRQAAVQHIERHHPDDHGKVLLGSIASVYMRENPGSDGVAWLMGEVNDEGYRESGFAQTTMQEMKNIGILSELMPDPSGRGLIQYQAPSREMTAPPQTVGINGVFINFFNAMAEQEGKPSYTEWDTSTPEGKAAKKRYIHRSKQLVDHFMSQKSSLDLEVREQEFRGKTRKFLFSVTSGRMFGSVAPADEDRLQVGQRITIQNSLVDDGRMRAIFTASTMNNSA